jgi:hypothetical protein
MNKMLKRHFLVTVFSSAQNGAYTTAQAVWNIDLQKN